MKKSVGISLLIIFLVSTIGFVIAQTNRDPYAQGQGSTAPDTGTAAAEPAPSDNADLAFQREMMMHVASLVAQSDDMYADWYYLYTSFDEMMGINDPEQLHAAMDQHRIMMEDFNRRATQLHIQYQALVQGTGRVAPDTTTGQSGRTKAWSGEKSVEPTEIDSTTGAGEAPGAGNRICDTSYLDPDHVPALDPVKDATEDTLKMDTLDA